jgi:hypothetical protein
MPYVYEHRCEACGYSAETVDGAPGVVVGGEVRELPWPDARPALAAMPDGKGAPLVNIERYWCLDCGTVNERVRDVHPQAWAGCLGGIVLGIGLTVGLALLDLRLASGVIAIVVTGAMLAPIVQMQRLEASRRTYREERPCRKCGGQDLLRPRDCPEDLPCPQCGQPATFVRLRRTGALLPPGRDYRS